MIVRHFKDDKLRLARSKAELIRTMVACAALLVNITTLIVVLLTR